MIRNWNNARSGQRKAVRVILDRLGRGDTDKLSVVLPCGYGKRDTIWLLGAEAVTLGLASSALVLNWSAVLRRQMVSDINVQAIRDRYGAQLPGRYTQLECLPSGPMLNPNGEFLISSTIQLIADCRDRGSPDVRLDRRVRDWIVGSRKKTGRPVLVLIDECHSYTASNTWGAILDELKAAGAVAVVFTGTAFRDDGAAISGFDTEPLRDEPVTIRRRVRAGGEMKVELWGATRQHYRLVPTYGVPYADAWSENVLCKINHQEVAVSLDFDGDLFGEPQMLSELSPAQARQQLANVLRRPMVIRQCVQTCVRWLKKMREMSGRNDLAAIIFTGNDRQEDDDGEVNRHGREVERHARDIDPSLRCVIATTAVDGSAKDRESLRRLEAFQNEGDILIVKQMAGTGLDIPRLKVGLDLSSVRGTNSTVQRMLRIARPYCGIHTSVWISPDDPLMLAIFRRFITEEGGAFEDKDLSLLDTITPGDGKSKQAPKVFTVRGVEESGIADNHDLYATRDDVRGVDAFLDTFAEIRGPISKTYTVPQIATRLKQLGWEPPAREPTPEIAAPTGDTSQEISLRRGGNAKIVNDIAAMVMRRRAGTKFEDVVPVVWRQVKARASLPESFDYRETRDLAALRAVEVAAQQLFEEERLRHG